MSIKISTFWCETIEKTSFKDVYENAKDLELQWQFWKRAKLEDIYNQMSRVTLNLFTLRTLGVQWSNRIDNLDTDPHIWSSDLS